MSFARLRMAFSLRQSLAHWGRVYLSIGPVGIVLGVFFAVLAHQLFEVKEGVAGRWIFAPLAVLFAPVCLAVLPRALKKSSQEVCFLIRAWSMCLSLSLAAGMFLGAIIGGMCHFAFDLELETALFKVAVPTLLTFIPFGFFVLAKRLRQAGII